MQIPISGSGPENDRSRRPSILSSDSNGLSFSVQHDQLPGLGYQEPLGVYAYPPTYFDYRHYPRQQQHNQQQKQQLQKPQVVAIWFHIPNCSATGFDVSACIRTSATSNGLPMEEAMAPTELMVVAVVDSPMYQQFILPPLNVGQDLFGLEDEVHGLAIFTEDPYLVEETKARIEGSGLLPYGWSSMSWVDQNKPRLEAIRT